MGIGKKRREVRTEAAPAALGPYSQAIRAGDWLFCSGQIGLEPDGSRLVSGGIRAQAERCLRNLQAVLEEEGASLEDLV